MAIEIAAIKVGQRYRQQLGNLAALAKSMERVGLLQPIVVDSNNNLICGARRLAAAKELGWATISVRTIDLDNPLEAERDENEQRLPFTVSELAAIGEAILKREKALAKDRAKATQAKPGEKVGANGKQGSSKSDAPKSDAPPKDSNAGKAERRAAAAVGMSAPTLKKAAAVVAAAQADPKTYGDIAAEMDRTGKVSPAYREMKNRQQQQEQATGPKYTPGEEDAMKFQKLRDKLADRWIDQYDKDVIRRCFKQLANEV